MMQIQVQSNRFFHLTHQNSCGLTLDYDSKGRYDKRHQTFALQGIMNS